MNEVILMGRITKDPELKATQSGMQILRFTLAVDRPKKKDQEDFADFISCVAFSRTAEIIANYVTKGQRMLINGSLHAGSYTDKSENKKYYMEVSVNHMEFVEKRGQAAPTVSFDDMGTTVSRDPGPMEQEEIPF